MTVEVVQRIAVDIGGHGGQEDLHQRAGGERSGRRKQNRLSVGAQLRGSRNQRSILGNMESAGNGGGVHGRVGNQRDRAIRPNARRAAAGTHGDHARRGGRGQHSGGERTAEIRQVIAHQVGHSAGGHNVNQCAGGQAAGQRDRTPIG